MNRIKALINLLLVLSMTAFTGCVIEDDVTPDDDPRSKYIGTWLVNEDCSRGNYTVNITADESNSSMVLIENFGNPGPGYDPAVAKVVGNSIMVTAQNIGEGWTVSGQGTYNSNGSILWSYSLVISASTENCTATFTQ